MDLLDVLILSIIEGITEFLPISSTGHLILTSFALHIPQTTFVKSFEIIIQLGAILAVVALYWKKILSNKSLWGKILIAFIPSAIIGFTLYKLIKEVLIGNPLVTVGALFFGGIALILIELFHKEKDNHQPEVEDITVRQSFIIGLFQSLSIIPGVSRAGATIVGGMLTGAKRKAAVEFSFLLAIPTMIGATGLDVLETKLSFTTEELTFLLIGSFLSFIIAILAIKFLIKYVQSHSFISFGIYRIVLSLIYYVVFLR